MNRLLLILFTIGIMGVFDVNAQVSLDPTKGRIELLSDYNKWDTIKTVDRTDHMIVIDFEKQTITIRNLETEEVVYNLKYVEHVDGSQPSAALQPGENVFMIRNENIELCGYQDMFQSFSISFLDQTSHSFLGIEY